MPAFSVGLKKLKKNFDEIFPSFPVAAQCLRFGAFRAFVSHGPSLAETGPSHGDGR